MLFPTCRFSKNISSRESHKDTQFILFVKMIRLIDGFIYLRNFSLTKQKEIEKFLRELKDISIEELDC